MTCVKICENNTCSILVVVVVYDGFVLSHQKQNTRKENNFGVERQSRKGRLSKGQGVGAVTLYWTHENMTLLCTVCMYVNKKKTKILWYLDVSISECRLHWTMRGWRDDPTKKTHQICVLCLYIITLSSFSLIYFFPAIFNSIEVLLIVPENSISFKFIT